MIKVTVEGLKPGDSLTIKVGGLTVEPITSQTLAFEGLYVTNSLGMMFSLVPAGEFVMGSTVGGSDERPPHRVRITKPLYLGVYEVTQGQYQRVMGTNPSYFKGDPQRPVERVSWDDAVAFCDKLSALPEERSAGRAYRLPTEAEWEYACRAGTTTKWSFGDDESAFGEYAWYLDNSRGTTHPVGQKKPNTWGLHDMHGNVYEWCQDWYKSDYYEESPTEDPPGSSTGSPRVLRGGEWGDDPSCCRSACRGRYGPVCRNYNIGFRVCWANVS